MATEADLIQKFKDLNIPVGSDFEELIHEAFIGANLVDQVNSKADDIKVVHTADMRKPAGDVAGIDEVNALQTQVDNSAVGTNLLINTSRSSNNGFTEVQGTSAFISGSYGRTDSYEQVTAPSSGELFYRFTWLDPNKLYGLTPGETYTLSGSASHTTGELDFRLGCSTNGKDWNGSDTTSDLGIPVSDGLVFTPFSHTFTIPIGVTGIHFGLENYDYTTGSLFRFNNMKLEKGSVATDWCPNPKDKADDSKVVHLSGSEEISGQKTFDVAPIDKATGKPYSTEDDVATAVNSATENVAYQNKDNNFTGNLLYKGSEVATVDLLQNFYQADDDNTARQKAESLTTPGFVWFSENEKIPAGTVISMTGTGYSTDTTTNIGLVDNLLADFSNVPTGIQLNFSSDVWLNTISAKMGTLADFKITPTTLQIPKNNIYVSSSSNAISLPLPGVTSLTYKSTNYTVDKSQANCNIYNNGGVLTFNRILGGFGSGDTTHYYLLSIDSITAY